MDAHHEDIKAAIRKAGGTIGCIAAGIGVAPATISAALRRPVSQRCDDAVANFLNVSPQTIWPSRYRDDGSRIRLRARSTVGHEAA